MDLRQEVNGIMASNESKESKTKDLLKIGLTNMDIRALFYHDEKRKKAEAAAIREARRAAAAARRAAAEARLEAEAQAAAEEARRQAEEAARRYNETLDAIFSRYTFGVEIECYNVNKADLIRTATNNGVEMHSEGYNHRDNDRYYKLVSDGSIIGSQPVECVSPILNGNEGGLDTLQATCRSLEAVGARVNKSTGLHVHVGGNITDTQYVNTFNNYNLLYDVICSFLAPSRRKGGECSRWCMPFRHEHVPTFRNATNPSRIIEALGSRYFCVNPESWRRHHTIEFRQHQGTTDFEKISMWVRFCVRLVHWSEANRLDHEVRTIADIPFLTDEEKAYFQGRADHFATRANR